MDVLGIEGIHNRRSVFAIPCLCRDGPNDGILVLVCGNCRSCARILEFSVGSFAQHDMPIGDGVVAKVVVAGCKEGVPLPVGHRAVASAAYGHSVQNSVALCMESAHLIAIDQVDHSAFCGLKKEVPMGS